MNLRSRRTLVAVGALLFLLAALVGWVTPGGAATGPSPFPIADPDGGYFTTDAIALGTTEFDVGQCGGGSIPRVNVPVIHAVGGDFGSACLFVDAMPSGAGGFAAGNSVIWAPSHNCDLGRCWLFYSFFKTVAPDHVCIARAEAALFPWGPYEQQEMVTCPSTGRWALDPDLFEDNGHLYMTYRNDAATSGNQTALSVVEINPSTGEPLWSTKRVLQYSTDVSWEYVGATNTFVIENPSMFRSSNGRLYLFFSGNQWNSPAYATGVADCGTSVLGGGRCTIVGSSAQPWFGYVGPGGLNPARSLQGNHPGPGGMDITEDPSGVKHVTWHYWSPVTGRRYALSGILRRAADGTFYVQ